MIYLDYASSTPVSPKALKAMQPFFSENFFNPSAPYLPAKHVREAYEAAKSNLAHVIGAKSADLVITSGATESINLAFTAVSPKGKILYLATEHDSVRNTAKAHSSDVIAVDHTGLIDLKDLAAKLTPEVELVSVALASGELGVVQPLAKISALLKAEKSRRIEQGIKTPLYLHSDASQALSLLDINVARLGVDLFTINGAKVYGPKGIGALYISHDVKLKPITYGGGQEMGLRSGTENVPALIGFSVAATEAKKHLVSNRKKYQELKALFKSELSKHSTIPPIFLGNPKHQLANFIPLSLPGCDAERLIYSLESQEIYLSTGAACSASKGKKSASFQAIGLTDQEINGSLRITLGSLNTPEQMHKAAEAIATLAKQSIYNSSSSSSKASLPSKNIKITPTPHVYLGMSGGVDSSVSALLLKNQGYHVTGVYMKNWSKDLPGMKCPWAEDLADAKRVATKLGLDFKIFDFEKQYKQKVVDYMLAEFKKGRTPNPDIMCNQEIKFKLFYEVARSEGADLIATGHYARIGSPSIAPNTPSPSSITPIKPFAEAQSPHPSVLLRAKDENKDQTYFLYRISQEAINHTIFPIGDMYKPEVKKLAAAHNLDNAYKKESMGVCFIGEVGIKDFLRQYLDSIPGPIIDQETGKKLGTHEGAIFYTIGQRHGLELGGGLPYYVVGKDITKNIIYVSRNLNNQNLWTNQIALADLLLRPLKNEDNTPSIASPLFVRLRHRGELLPATLKDDVLHFDTQVKSPAPGQSAVLYAGPNAEVCLGGGIIK
ncbi:tRNA 2-thiouridine(34) synthase MnmA [Candidatus Saccharibacteria bacterium]|nr:tRNA 2-thiouridine(34) synthase MnmA [Candidatus Saccharibacteria bacterium]